LNVLVLGTGGREHALAWRLAQNTNASKNQVYLHPGNAGTIQQGLSNLGDVPMNHAAIAAAAKSKQIELVVIGPEILLNEGYGDFLRKEGFPVVGPGKDGAQLEVSKIFAKEFMVRAGIPTAPFRIFKTETDLTSYVPESWPVVLKFDGLAAGKGVVIAKCRADLSDFARRVYHDQEFGPGDHRVLVEDCLPGKELSYIGLCDGKTFVPLASATDFKRVGDADTGPNTGGMGAVSPSPLANPSLEKKIQERVIAPLLKQLGRESWDYRGALYVGIMISPTGDPYVLEFNARFGDPETQAILMRWEGDVASPLLATANARLEQEPRLQWRNDTAIYVVAAAEGYPGQVTTGDVIEGLADVDEATPIFFSGVKQLGGKLVTNGGRVLGVGAFGADVDSARRLAYASLARVQWRGQHFRKDIGIL